MTKILRNISHIFIMFTLITQLSFAYQNTNRKNKNLNLYQNYTYGISVNPLSLLFGILNFQIEFYKYKINDFYPLLSTGFFIYSSSDWSTFGLSLGGGVRKYFNNNYPEKAYYTLYGGIGIISAKYKPTDDSTTSAILSLGANIGYKFTIPNSRFYLDPSLGIALFLGKVSVSGHDLGTFSGITPTLGLSLGYNF